MADIPMRFETLIERYHDEIYHYLWRMLDGGSPDRAIHAEDLTQDVFMRAYRAFDRLRPNSNYRAWLYKIATNRAYTALKRRGRKLPDAELDEEVQYLANDHPDHQDVLIFRESVAEVGAAIKDLPAKQQAALVMRYVQGLDYDEIAAALDCSEDSARANVSHAIRRLRRQLSQERCEE